MLKKVITFKDYNGVECTETHYFDLSQAEIMEMQMEANGSLAERYQNLVDSKDAAGLMKEFKFLICKSHGVRSEDGKHFYKTEQGLQDFLSSPAYSALFMELTTNAEAASAFANGILPIEEMKKSAEVKAVEKKAA